VTDAWYSLLERNARDRALRDAMYRSKCPSSLDDGRSQPSCSQQASQSRVKANGEDRKNTWLCFDHCYTRLTFLSDEGKIGVLPRLGYFFRQAGCIHIQQKAYVVDYSVETEAHRAWYQNFMMSFNLLQPFMLKMGVTTQQEVSHLYQQALSEMWMDDFCAVWLYLSVWGEKPKE
jgi:hypothetical protein